MSTPVPTVAVGAIVFDASERVLLVQRGKPPGVGLWTVPGGKVELGEALAAAVEREVLEECSLVVRSGALVEVIERVIEHDTGLYHYIILDYLAELAPNSEPPRAGDDATSTKWVAWTDLASLPLTDGLVAVLDRARTLHRATTLASPTAPR